MNKLLLTALAAALAGAAIAQDTTNKDQTTPPKTDQAATQAPTVKTFADYQIGMAFDYPPTWVEVEDPKAPKNKKLIPDSIIGKKSKKQLAPGKQAQGESLFYIPAGSHTADLEIYGALWDQAPDIWESNQVQVNNDLKRQVVKQWREQILGVPLLLTKIAYDDAAGHEVGLIGLVYSRTPYKMLFRLTAPDTDYDTAESNLRDVLQTLRTTSGDLPVPEDPNHPLDKSAYVDVKNTPPKMVVLTAPTLDPTKAKKGAVVVAETVANQKANLTLPTGWTADAPGSDGTIALHSAALTGPITITLASILDSDPPQAAVLKASAQSLALFAKVDDRTEKQNAFSTAGDTTDIIWRHGTDDKGALTTCDAVGGNGQMYWLLSYRLNSATTPAEMKALNDLVDVMSIDPVSS